MTGLAAAAVVPGEPLRLRTEDHPMKLLRLFLAPRRRLTLSAGALHRVALSVRVGAVRRWRAYGSALVATLLYLAAMGAGLVMVASAYDSGRGHEVPAPAEPQFDAP
jgi:hypothetical protein